MAFESIEELIDDVRETLETLESDPEYSVALDFKASVEKFVEDYGYDADDLLDSLSAIDKEVTTFVPVDGLTKYAESYITDVYGLDNIPGILSTNIDWDGVAEDLSHTLSEYTIDGVDYYVS